MAEAISITGARASNPDLSEVFALFDDVLASLTEAVALEEDIHVAALSGEIPDGLSLRTDAVIGDARRALQRAVAQPPGDHRTGRALLSVLHTLNLALMLEDVPAQAKALTLVSRHPALTPSEVAGPVATRLHRLRDLVDRMQALAAPGPHAAPVAVDAPGF